MIPLSVLDSFLVDKDEHASNARKFLLNQYPEHVGYHELPQGRVDSRTMFESLAADPVDIILMDNFMDVAASLMRATRWKEYENSTLFLNPHFYKNEAEVIENFTFTGYLSAQESALNWLAIYKYIRTLQPTARIFFLSFMACTSAHSPERAARARDFYTEFEPLARAEDIEIVPPIELPPHLLVPGDWSHVDMRIYRALAGYVYLKTVADVPRSQFSHISSSVISRVGQCQ